MEIEKEFKATLTFPNPAVATKEEVFKFIEENHHYLLMLWVEVVELNGGWVGVTYRNKISEEIRRQLDPSHAEETQKKVSTTRSGAIRIPKRADLRVVESDNLKPQLEGKDLNHPLYNKKIVFTGLMKNINRNFAAQKAKDKGADVDTSISNNTDFVVVGEDAGWRKMETIEKMQSDGHRIKVLSEEEYLKIIDL